MSGGNLLEYTAAPAGRVGEVVVAERAVGDQGNLTGPAPGQDGVFGGALLQMVEDLVANQLPWTCELLPLTQVRIIEVAHTPGENLAAGLQDLESPQGLFEGNAATPV